MNSTLEQQISEKLDSLELDGARPVFLAVGHRVFLSLFGPNACEAEGCTTFRDISVRVYSKGAKPYAWEFELVDDLPTLIDNLPIPDDDGFAEMANRTRRLAWASIVVGVLLMGLTVAGLLGVFR
jgi:hypothetical protein